MYQNNKLDISVSIVIYNTSKTDLIRVIRSIKKYHMGIEILIIDNSEKPTRKELCKHMGVNYQFNNNNLGYGCAHNISLRRSLKNKNKYHVIVNPDVYFEDNVFKKLYEYMEENQDVGLISPKILYPNSSLQYLCKLVPDPFHLAFRKIFPNSKIVNIQNRKYELKFTGYNKTMDVPLISGCFMFIRTSLLHSTGFFDERYFMYLEDFDLCRRFNKISSIVFYPHAFIYHEYMRGHAKDIKLLIYFIRSAIKYFNKWGWFFDKERKEVNLRTLKNLNFKD
jgi:GT2 family glycosyltransferase